MNYFEVLEVLLVVGGGILRYFMKVCAVFGGICGKIWSIWQY